MVKLICKEYSNKEIAKLLNSSLKSIESTRERIQGKIGAVNMVGIAMYAIKHNIFSVDDYSLPQDDF